VYPHEALKHLGMLRLHLLALHHRANVGLAVAGSAGPVLQPVNEIHNGLILMIIWTGKAVGGGKKTSYANWQE